MRLVLEESFSPLFATYRETSVSHQILVAYADGSLNAPWHQVRDRAQFSVPLHTLQITDARDFLSRRILALHDDGCLLVAYWQLDNAVEMSLLFSIGAKYVGPQPELAVMEDSKDALADVVVNTICVREVMGS